MPWPAQPAESQRSSDVANPYTAPTLSGYNANPPADDGSAVAANQLEWAKHKDKIGDPLKTYAEAISANVTTAFASRWLNGVSSKASPYTVATSDEGKLFLVSSATTITLLAAGTAGDGFSIVVFNTNTDTDEVTIDGDGSETINGQTTWLLGGQSAIQLTCDGSNWHGTVMNARGTLAKTSAYTAKESDHGKVILADASSAGFTVTLLAAATAGAGYTLTVVKTDATANAVTIDADSSETINGSLTWLLDGPDDLVTLTSNGSNWIMTARSAKGIKPKTSAYTVIESDHGKTITCDASSAGFTVTLPAAATAGRGFRLTVLKDESSVNAVTIDANGSETINAALTKVLRNAYDAAELICDGTEWYDLNERMRPTTFQAATACASGTSQSITGIPDGVTEIAVTFKGISLDAANDKIVLRLGDSGGLQTSGYDATSSNASGSTVNNESTGIFLTAAAVTAGTAQSGRINFTLIDPTNDIWAFNGGGTDDATADLRHYAGTVTLDSALDRVGFVVVGGTGDAFDGSGIFNVRWS